MVSNIYYGLRQRKNWNMTVIAVSITSEVLRQMAKGKISFLFAQPPHLWWITGWFKRCCKAFQKNSPISLQAIHKTTRLIHNESVALWMNHPPPHLLHSAPCRHFWLIQPPLMFLLVPFLLREKCDECASELLTLLIVLWTTLLHLFKTPYWLYFLLFIRGNNQND